MNDITESRLETIAEQASLDFDDATPDCVDWCCERCQQLDDGGVIDALRYLLLTQGGDAVSTERLVAAHKKFHEHREWLRELWIEHVKDLAVNEPGDNGAQTLEIRRRADEGCR